MHEESPFIEATDPTKLRGPQYPFVRKGAVRIVLPGIDDPEQRFTGKRLPLLTPLVTEVLTEIGAIRELEVLTFPGRGQMEHILTPKLYGNRTDGSVKTYSLNPDTTSETHTSEHLDRISQKLAERLAEYLPPEYGVERCHVHLAPFGRSPAPTNRLFMEQNRESTESNFYDENPMALTIKDNISQGIPHATQTLIRPNGDKFNISARIVNFDSRKLPQSSWEFAALLKNGRPWQLKDIWEAVGVESQAGFPIKDFWERKGAHAVPQERKYLELSDSYRARELYTGRAEFEEFLQGRSGYDELYKKVLGYGRMPVTAEQLNLFLPVVSAYPEESFWEPVAPRGPAVITTVDVERTATGTDHALGIDTTASIPHNSEHVANRGSDKHEYLLQFALNYFREQGYPVRRIEQDTSSVPDAVVVIDGVLCYIEVAVNSLSKPANILKNKARGIYEDRPVIFVVDSESDAEKLYDHLLTPFDERVDDGVGLFNTSTLVTLPDGSTPILPDGVQEADWVLTHDGELELRAGERVLASGPADESVSEFDFQTRRLRTTDDGYALISETGTVIDRGPSAKYLLDGAVRVHQPHVPMDLHYLRNTEIRYQVDHGLSVYDEAPTWVSENTGLEDQYEGMLSEFLRHYTWTDSDAELRWEEFCRRARFFYYFRLHNGMVPDDWEPKKPTKGYIGRGLPDDYDTKRREVDDTMVKFNEDLTWIYPPGIVSSDLPFIGDDTETWGEPNEQLTQ